MDRLPIEFHPAAIREAAKSRRWYARQSPSAAAGFDAELDSAVERIQENPDLFAHHLRGTRRYLMHRFPFVVVYRLFPDRIQVIAVAHGRRKPDYWRRRT
jgi:toxin ParE1/3/4